jgi:hypothetical protein
MAMLRVLYKSLLRAARSYDVAAWNRAHLFDQPALRQRLPSITFYLGSASCQHLMRRAFREPLTSAEVSTSSHACSLSFSLHSLPDLLPCASPLRCRV